MPGRRSSGGRRLRTLQAAQHTLDELGLDPSRPVDVFDAVDRLGLWLTFLPLHNLLGAVVPEGDGGVLITTERPASVQRYTAAHEVGHWVLDHQLALDGEVEVHGTHPAEREQMAQLFASYFLMPPPLILGTAARHGVRPGSVPTPAQVYLMARDVGASYEAVVRQLYNLDYYSWPAVESLLRTPPMTAKRDAAYGVRPRDGRADVWPVDPRSDHAQVDVKVGDAIVVVLPENRTTGYRWLTEEQESERRYRRPHLPPPRLGAASTRQQEEPLPAPREPAPRPAAAVRDALRLLPDAAAAAEQPATYTADRQGALVVVEDLFQPGWTSSLPPRFAPGLRRRTAGDATVALPGPLGDVAARAGIPPPVGATGRRLLAVETHAEGVWSVQFTLSPPFDAQAEPAATFTLTSTVQLGPVAKRRRQLLEVDLDEHLPGDPPDSAVFFVDAAMPSDPERS